MKNEKDKMKTKHKIVKKIKISGELLFFIFWVAIISLMIIIKVFVIK
jgi:hypothetical protein